MTFDVSGTTTYSNCVYIHIDIFGYQKYRYENKNIDKYQEKKCNEKVKIKKIV